MKHAAPLLVVLILLAVPADAANVKMPPAPAIELEAADPLPSRAGLYLPGEFRSVVAVVKTSPFDKLSFPIGEFTAALLELNLPQAFAAVVPLTSAVPADPAAVDLVVSVEIVRFELTIPHPAYNPYVATAVYKLTVTEPGGETLFTQTATGSGQTSKGMMSGFKAQGLAAEAAKLAMVDAGKQALEGLLAADELREAITPPPASEE
jgi:hypothetical protein